MICPEKVFFKTVGRIYYLLTVALDPWNKYLFWKLDFGRMLDIVTDEVSVMCLLKTQGTQKMMYLYWF